MPELPEVETVRRGLERAVVGRTFTSVTVLHPRAARRHAEGIADLEARLTGRRVDSAQRRGKYTWLTLAPEVDGPAEGLVLHLGMSGQLLTLPPSSPDGPHLRTRFALDDGSELRFVDQRTFGGLALDALIDDAPSSIRHIARDPLDPQFDDAAFATALRSRRTGLKRALLDQTLISGIGNIYADEALWRAKLHYAKPAASLRPAQIRELLTHVREILRAALESGGTSFDALYVDINGQSGRFDQSLNAYGQGGRPCARCGTAIVREPFMNRSSFRCPQCQRGGRRGGQRGGQRRSQHGPLVPKEPGQRGKTRSQLADTPL